MSRISFDFDFILIYEEMPQQVDIYTTSIFGVEAGSLYDDLSSELLVYPIYEGNLTFSVSNITKDEFQKEYIGDLTFSVSDKTSVMIADLPYHLVIPTIVKVGSPEWLSYKTIASVSCDDKVCGGIFAKYNGEKLYSVYMNPNTKEIGLLSYHNGVFENIFTKKVNGLYNEAFYDLELDSIVIGLMERQLYFHEYFVGLVDRPTFGSAHVPDRWIIKPRNISTNPNIDIFGGYCEIIDGNFVAKDALFKINKLVPERSILSIRFSISYSSEMIVFMGVSNGNMDVSYSLHISPYLAILVHNYIEDSKSVSETIGSVAMPRLFPGIFYHLWIEHYNNYMRISIDGITIFELTTKLGPGELYIKSNNICSFRRIEITGIGLDHDIVLDMNDYRSFCNLSTYIGDNFWLTSSARGPSTLFRAYYEKEPFFEFIVNSVELGTTGLISFVDENTDINQTGDLIDNKLSCSDFEVIGLPLYETIIAPNRIENRPVPIRIIAPKENFPFGYLFI